MSELKNVANFPWQPQSFITGNLAIGNLCQNLILRFKTERGVHAETLLVAIGAITGFAAQNAVWKGVQKGAVPAGRFNVVTTKAGEKFYFGDALNAYLLPQPGGTDLTLWTLVAGQAVQLGIPGSELPSLNDMFSYVAKTIGSENFGVPRVPPEHKSHLTLYQVLKMTWPLACQIMRLPLPEKIPAQEPPLQEGHWPIVMSVVAAQLLKRTKDVLDPRLGIALIMETAIAASKVDPASLQK